MFWCNLYLKKYIKYVFYKKFQANLNSHKSKMSHLLLTNKYNWKIINFNNWIINEKWYEHISKNLRFHYKIGNYGLTQHLITLLNSNPKAISSQSIDIRNMRHFIKLCFPLIWVNYKWNWQEDYRKWGHFLLSRN